MLIKDRIELAEHFNKLGFKTVVEIGTADGRYAEILCQKIPMLDMLYTIDPYIPYNGNWRSQDYQNKAYQKAKSRLEKYNAQIINKTSMDALQDFDNGDIDAVFIDGDHHFDYVMEDIIAWSRKVKKGGIVSLHDYYSFSSGGVVEAVDAYVKAHNIDLQLTLKNNDGHQDDRVPCAWWIKK
jgi:predicted O-methyltransferase YrrM